MIIFPYAYHQGFNAGPNITEEVMYASDRWEVFHREKLYQHCSRNCAGGKAESFDLDFVKKGILSPRDHRHRRRTQELSVTIAQQLGDTAEDEEEEEEEEEEIPSQRRRPKASPHSAGLRAMDRVDDDGEWEETYLGNNPNGGKITRRNKKGQVAAQGKTDMWNVESVLGDADDEASPFITPKNPLKRGRDRALEDFDGQRPLSGAEKRARKGY